MRGCRPLNRDELKRMEKQFHGKNKLRDLCFFMIGIFCGYRAREILSLKIGDVWQHGCCVDVIEVRRQNMKCKKQSRQVYVHKYCRVAIKKLIQHYITIYGEVHPEWPLFISREGNFKAITYVSMYLVIKRAARAAKLTGKIACHSLRKSFCKLFLEKSKNDIMALMRVLQHSSPVVTMQYIAFDDEEYNRKVLLFEY